MPEEERGVNKSNSSFVYLLVGLGVGWFLSAMLARKSGPETREKLSATLKESSAELKERATAAVETGRNVATGIAAAAKAGLETYRQEIAKAKAAGAGTES